MFLLEWIFLKSLLECSICNLNLKEIRIKIKVELAVQKKIIYFNESPLKMNKKKLFISC